MLALVLDDEAEDERAPEQRIVAVERRLLERAQRPLADALDVVARRLGAKQRQLAAAAALVHEGVVELLALGEERRHPADPLADPEILEVADVGEIPDERRLERRPLRRELLVVERGEEHERRVASAVQLGGDGDAAVGGRWGHGGRLRALTRVVSLSAARTGPAEGPANRPLPPALAT